MICKLDGRQFAVVFVFSLQFRYEFKLDPRV
jgi:hypothetical protein